MRSRVIIAVWAGLPLLAAAGCVKPAAKSIPAAPPATQPDAPGVKVGPAGSPATQPERVAPRPPAARGPVEFFAMKDQAARVAFVLDSSGSMFARFAALQAEVIRAVESLRPGQEFRVMFFSDGPPIEFAPGGKADWQPTSPANKKALAEWVNEQHAQSKSGDTQPAPSLERALSAKDASADAIFLLTDGLFPPGSAERIAELNATAKARVHTILFVLHTPDSEAVLRRIATDSGGQYRFLSDRDLDSSPDGEK